MTIDDLRKIYIGSIWEYKQQQITILELSDFNTSTLQMRYVYQEDPQSPTIIYETLINTSWILKESSGWTCVKKAELDAQYKQTKLFAKIRYLNENYQRRHRENCLQE